MDPAAAAAAAATRLLANETKCTVAKLRGLAAGELRNCSVTELVVASLRQVTDSVTLQRAAVAIGVVLHTALENPSLHVDVVGNAQLVCVRILLSPDFLVWVKTSTLAHVLLFCPGCPQCALARQLPSMVREKSCEYRSLGLTNFRVPLVVGEVLARISVASLSNPSAMEPFRALEMMWALVLRSASQDSPLQNDPQYSPKLCDALLRIAASVELSRSTEALGLAVATLVLIASLPAEEFLERLWQGCPPASGLIAWAVRGYPRRLTPRCRSSAKCMSIFTGSGASFLRGSILHNALDYARFVSSVDLTQLRGRVGYRLRRHTVLDQSGSKVTLLRLLVEESGSDAIGWFAPLIAGMDSSCVDLLSLKQRVGLAVEASLHRCTENTLLGLIGQSREIICRACAALLEASVDVEPSTRERTINALGTLVYSGRTASSSKRSAVATLVSRSSLRSCVSSRDIQVELRTLFTGSHCTRNEASRLCGMAMALMHTPSPKRSLQDPVPLDESCFGAKNIFFAASMERSSMEALVDRLMKSSEEVQFVEQWVQAFVDYFHKNQNVDALRAILESLLMASTEVAKAWILALYVLFGKNFDDKWITKQQLWELYANMGLTSACNNATDVDFHVLGEVSPPAKILAAALSKSELFFEMRLVISSIGDELADVAPCVVARSIAAHHPILAMFCLPNLAARALSGSEEKHFEIATLQRSLEVVDVLPFHTGTISQSLALRAIICRCIQVVRSATQKTSSDVVGLVRPLIMLLNKMATVDCESVRLLIMSQRRWILHPGTPASPSASHLPPTVDALLRRLERYFPAASHLIGDLRSNLEGHQDGHQNSGKMADSLATLPVNEQTLERLLSNLYTAPTIAQRVLQEVIAYLNAEGCSSEPRISLAAKFFNFCRGDKQVREFAETLRACGVDVGKLFRWRVHLKVNSFAEGISVEETSAGNIGRKRQKIRGMMNDATLN